MTSETILQAASQADLDALVAALFERYYQPICTYIFCLVDEWELAHDLTQETFLQLFDTRQRLHSVENPRAWIYRIATHLTLNKLKRQRRFAWLPWHKLDNTPHFRWQAPDEEVNRRAAVENALAALPPHTIEAAIKHSFALEAEARNRRDAALIEGYVDPTANARWLSTYRRNSFDAARDGMPATQRRLRLKFLNCV